MGKQNGQGIVEFAVVLPFFMLVVMGIFYFSMAFADFLAMNNIARGAAGEASRINFTEMTSSGAATKLDEIEEKCRKGDYGEIVFDFYDYDVKVSRDQDESNVTVRIDYQISDGTWIGRIMNNFTQGNEFAKSKNDPIVYKMYNPNIKTKS